MPILHVNNPKEACNRMPLLNFTLVSALLSRSNVNHIWLPQKLNPKPVLLQSNKIVTKGPVTKIRSTRRLAILAYPQLPLARMIIAPMTIPDHLTIVPRINPLTFTIHVTGAKPAWLWSICVAMTLLLAMIPCKSWLSNLHNNVTMLMIAITLTTCYDSSDCSSSQRLYRWILVQSWTIFLKYTPSYLWV